MLSGDRLVEEVQQSPVGLVYLARLELERNDSMAALQWGPIGTPQIFAFAVAAALAFAEALMAAVHTRWQLQRLGELAAEALNDLPLRVAAALGRL